MEKPLKIMVASTVYGFEDQLSTVCATLRNLKYKAIDCYVRAYIKVHRDYSLLMNYININLYSNGLEINNPGELPNGINLSDLKKKHPSVLRNPDIAQICFIRGYIEMLGTGTLRMIDDCISNGYKEPEWQVAIIALFLFFLILEANR